MGDFLKRAWEWINRNFWWLKFIGIAIAAVIGYRFLSTRIARIVDALRGKRAHWTKIPGNSHQIVVTDPDSGKSEIVHLPDNVTSSEVISAGKAEEGKYEVEIRHDRTDRRDSTGDGDALDRLGK